jgi:hypothetical protein
LLSGSAKVMGVAEDTLDADKDERELLPISLKAG